MMSLTRFWQAIELVDNSPSQPDRAARRWRVLATVSIFVAAFIVYWPSLKGGFILDDDILLTDSQLIKSADGLRRIWFTTEPLDYWPVTYSTLWIEWRLWGTRPVGYRVTNLLLHAMASILIWLILDRLKIPGGWLAAMLFALHPVNVESVAWISQRKNTLSIVFLLLSILWFIHDGHLWRWLSLLAFVLGMLSKGSVAMLPALLLAIAWWRKGRIKASDWLAVSPFVIVAVGLAAVNVWFQSRLARGSAGGLEPLQRLAMSGTVIWFYLLKAVLPTGLSFVYPKWSIRSDQWLWWLPLFAVIVVTLMLWRQRDRWARGPLLAWICFCASLTPVMGFTDVIYMRSYSLVADRYQYVAIIAVVSLLAAIWRWWQTRAPLVASTLAVVVCAMLGYLTWQRSALFADATKLYRATLEINPTCWLIHNNLGRALETSGQLPQAIESYQRAAQIAPQHADTHYNLGSALAQAGQFPQAIAELQEALRLKPDFADAHYNLGNSLMAVGQVRRAIEHYHQAVRLKPDSPAVHNNLATALASVGLVHQALPHFKQTVELDSTSPVAWFNFAQASAQAGQSVQAVNAAKTAERLARAKGDAALANTIAGWLAHYRPHRSLPASLPAR